MNRYPRTLSEAQQLRYGVRASRPVGTPYTSERCAMPTWEQSRWPIEYQCKRKPGHGPGQLYCKQHATIVERREGKE